MNRPSAAKRGYGRRWQKCRKLFVDKHPLCERCLQIGRLTPTEEVDHIIPHKGDMTLFWDEANWQSMCKACHSAKTALEGTSSGRQGQARPDWLPVPSCRVVVVCGPPASGKSSYVRQHARPSDPIIDLDDIAAELAGTGLYQHGKEWVGPALHARNRRIADLARAPSDVTGWLIVGAPSPVLRQWWADKLNAEIVLLDVDADVCKTRIDDDGRRRAVAHEQKVAVDRWWMLERSNAAPLKRGTNSQGIPTDPLHPWNRPAHAEVVL